MKLEVVDKKNPSLIRPATITMVDEYEIKVLFLGWPETYAYWVDDDSPDIHPINWARKTGHPIDPPPVKGGPVINACGIAGCTGLGNGKHVYNTHHTKRDECPYEPSNWVTNDKPLPNRVERKQPNLAIAQSHGGYLRYGTEVGVQPAQKSLQSLLTPTELLTMTPKDVDLFRRLQVSTQFLLDNSEQLSKVHTQWLSQMQPLRSIQLAATRKNPLNWTVDEVADFVSQLPNCSLLKPIFIEHDIDGVAFLSLRQMDMIKIMGLSMGSAIKVFNRIVYLRQECNANYINYS